MVLGGDQAVGKDPAYDLMRERVCQEMQQAATPSFVGIGDVSHPQLVDLLDGQSLTRVPVLPVAMVGACRDGASGFSIGCDSCISRRTSPGRIVRIEFLEHQVQLVRPDARSLMPDILTVSSISFSDNSLRMRFSLLTE